MGSSAKKKREKKADFQKTKLKVGKARPKNTNATSTSFTAKSIVFKQQSLSETSRDTHSLVNHNISLLSSRNEAQRKDALAYLTASISGSTSILAQPASVMLGKAQPLLLDGNSAVRQQCLKLLKALPREDIGSLDQLLLYTRAGMTHLSHDIRLTALDVLDWLLEHHSASLLHVAGAWVKTLRTFQNLLSWHSPAVPGTNDTSAAWSASKPTTSTGNSKTSVRQLTTLSRFLNIGLARAPVDPLAAGGEAADKFPLWHVSAHTIARHSNAFGYLNLFGAPRDVEGESYESVDERVNVFVELDLPSAFAKGVKEAKQEGGEVGRAAAMVQKALILVDAG